MKSAYAAGMQPTNRTDAFVVTIDQIALKDIKVVETIKDGKTIIPAK